MSDLSGTVNEIIAKTGPVAVRDLLAAVHEAGLTGVTPSALMGFLEAGKAQGTHEVSIERHAGSLSTGYPRWRLAWQPMDDSQVPDPVLVWGKPPKAESYEDWAAYQADSAPPGTYIPNMPDNWKRAWKATMRGQRSGDLHVEIRKSVQIRHAGSVQVKIVVYEIGDVLVSANGVAGFTSAGWAALQQAVSEAHAAMRVYRDAHPRPLPPRNEEGQSLCAFCQKGYVWDRRRRCDECRPA